MAPEVLFAMGVSAVGFVSTNVDNLVVLTLFTASGRAGRAPVLAAYWVSLLAVVGAALATGFVDTGQWSPRIGLLGLVPAGVGLIQLASRLARGGGLRTAALPPAGFVPVTAAFLAMSVDSLAVLLPLVADSADRLEWAVIVAWLAAGLVWTVLAGALARRPGVAGLVERAGSWLAPLLMIGVGLYILMDTPTDVLPG